MIESMLLDPCPKVLILKIPPRPPRGIPLLKKKEPSTTKVRCHTHSRLNHFNHSLSVQNKIELSRIRVLITTISISFLQEKSYPRVSMARIENRRLGDSGQGVVEGDESFIINNTNCPTKIVARRSLTAAYKIVFRGIAHLRLFCLFLFL